MFYTHPIGDCIFGFYCFMCLFVGIVYVGNTLFADHRLKKNIFQKLVSFVPFAFLIYFLFFDRKPFEDVSTLPLWCIGIIATAVAGFVIMF